MLFLLLLMLLKLPGAQWLVPSLRPSGPLLYCVHHSLLQPSGFITKATWTLTARAAWLSWPTYRWCAGTTCSSVNRTGSTCVRLAEER